MYNLEYQTIDESINAEDWVKEVTARFIYGEPIGWLRSLIGTYHAGKVFTYLESLVINKNIKGFKVPSKVQMSNETIDPIIDDVVAKLTKEQFSASFDFWNGNSTLTKIQKNFDDSIELLKTWKAGYINIQFISVIDFKGIKYDKGYIEKKVVV